MTITEFARSRDLQVNTVSKYIREHQEFTGHVRSVGKSRLLDDTALEMLDKKYPLPKPVQIVQGIPEEEHLSALSAKDEQIQALQQIIIDLQQRQADMIEELGDYKGKCLLLEDKARQVEELRSELESERNKSIWERIFKR